MRICAVTKRSSTLFFVVLSLHDANEIILWVFNYSTLLTAPTIVPYVVNGSNARIGEY